MATDLEEAIRLAEIGEYLFNACRYSGGDGYTEPREMGIDWQWQQSAPSQYGEGMLLVASTKWHDEQAEDGIVTEARKLRSALAYAPDTLANAVVDFPEAMRAVLSGQCVRRADWNRPHFVSLHAVDGMRFLVMQMRDGTRGPYTPSGCDMLASDWHVLPATPAGRAALSQEDDHAGK